MPLSPTGKRIGYMDWGGPLLFRRGSDYKFWRLLDTIYGVEEIDAREENHEHAVASVQGHEYDMVVLPGDRSNSWEIAHESGVPYILSQHDVQSMRTRASVPHERPMIENARAVLFTSEHHARYCARKYRLPPFAVIHLRPMAEALVFAPLPKLPGKTLVYAGGLTNWERRGDAFGYRAYHQTFGEFVKEGWEVHLYTPYNSRVYGEYREIGCITHSPVPQARLYPELSQYMAGYHGYNPHGTPRAALAYAYCCIPNKCWEYLAAGIPTIGINAGLGGHIYDGKWGLVKPDSVDTQGWLAGIEYRLPKITEELRFSQTMDEDIPRVKKILDPIML